MLESGSWGHSVLQTPALVLPAGASQGLPSLLRFTGPSFPAGASQISYF